MTIPSPTTRALRIAVGVELAWAMYLAYAVHHYSDQLGWRLLVVNYVDEWAHAAIAIVVVIWLADVAAARHRGGAPETRPG